jgi:hypothetical protein
MARGLLRFVLPLYLFFIALMAALLLRPYDNSALRALFISSDDCVLPCWQGIRPGITSGKEAIAILENHDWVDYVQVRGDFDAGNPGAITWTWSGAQPAMLGVNRTGGRVLVIRNVVRYVRLSTTLGFGDIWLGFNHPDLGRFEGPSGSTTRPEMYHQALYDGGILVVESIVYCPVRYDKLWNSPVTVEFREAMTLIPLVEYELAKWMADPAC